MKKNILLLMSLCLLTGCTINYNAEITDDKIKETISGTVSKSEYEVSEFATSPNLYYTLLNEEQYPVIGSDDIYTTNNVETKEGIDYNYSYTYKMDEFKNSKLLKSCYEYVDIEETDDYFMLNLSGVFECQYVDKINVKITTDYMVSENNADKVKDNTYIWNITKDNTDINMLILKVKDETKNSKARTDYIRIIGGIIFGILLIISLVIWKRKNNAN